MGRAQKKSEHANQRIAQIYALVSRSRDLLASGQTTDAVAEGRAAFKLARSNRSHWPLSDAWLAFVEALAADQPSESETEYLEVTKGAFYWAETMPEEIQIWLLPGLLPHLDRLGLDRLEERAGTMVRRAQDWLTHSRNVSARIEQMNVADAVAGRPIDERARAAERMAVFYADEGWDSDGALLSQAANMWATAGREDRARFLQGLAAELAARGET